MNKFLSEAHGVSCVPGHGRDRAFSYPEVSTMSSHTCQLCPRSVHRPQRKVGKRKRLTPLTLKWVPWLGGGSGASGIRALAHSTLVTRQSFFRRRCARRRGASSNRAALLTLCGTASNHA
jgi:hypothetical protein